MIWVVIRVVVGLRKRGFPNEEYMAFRSVWLLFPLPDSMRHVPPATIPWIDDDASVAGYGTF